MMSKQISLGFPKTPPGFSSFYNEQDFKMLVLTFILENLSF